MSYHKHVIDSRQFTLGFLDRLFARTDEFIKADLAKDYSFFPTLRKYRLEQFYWQPSTRTASSFGAAARKIGMANEYYQNAGEFSSFAKGESLEHGIQAVDSNHEILVIRHHESGVPYLASLISSKPVINAGDGDNQHPTQALLDTYNIYDYFDNINNLKIVIVGECDGRVSRSLTYLLAKHGRGNEFFFVAPDEFRPNEEFLVYLQRKKIKYSTVDDIDEVIQTGNVFYATRLRKERLEYAREKDIGRKMTKEEKEQVTKEYIKLREKNHPKLVINGKRACNMKNDAVIMHPLPIDRMYSNGFEEITEDVDANSRQTYLKTSNEGWAIRAALLEALATNNEIAQALDNPNYEKIWKDIYKGDPAYSPEGLRKKTEWREREKNLKKKRIEDRENKRRRSMI